MTELAVTELAMTSDQTPHPMTMYVPNLMLVEPPSQVCCLTRVLLVDECALFRNGVVFSLREFANLRVVAQAASGEEALQMCGEVHPDVVLIDMIMPGMNGVATIRALRAAYPEVQVLALTSSQEGGVVHAALEAGAIGYLLKDVAIDELAHAIQLAHRGVPSLAPAAAQALVHTVISQPPKIGHDLTEREREVLELLAEGISNQQIADQLVLSQATVKFHIRHIRSKLGTASRTETVVLALQQHLVSPR
jgi:NarL family two-component system response regulator LiaR